MVPAPTKPGATVLGSWQELPYSGSTALPSNPLIVERTPREAQLGRSLAFGFTLPAPMSVDEPDHLKMFSYWVAVQQRKHDDGDSSPDGRARRPNTRMDRVAKNRQRKERLLPTISMVHNGESSKLITRGAELGGLREAAAQVQASACMDSKSHGCAAWCGSSAQKYAALSLVRRARRALCVQTPARNPSEKKRVSRRTLQRDRRGPVCGLHCDAVALREFDSMDPEEARAELRLRKRNWDQYCALNGGTKRLDVNADIWDAGRAAGTVVQGRARRTCSSAELLPTRSPTGDGQTRGKRGPDHRLTELLGSSTSPAHTCAGTMQWQESYCAAHGGSRKSRASAKGARVGKPRARTADDPENVQDSPRRRKASTPRASFRGRRRARRWPEAQTEWRAGRADTARRRHEQRFTHGRGAGAGHRHEREQWRRTGARNRKPARALGAGHARSGAGQGLAVRSGTCSRAPARSRWAQRRHTLKQYGGASPSTGPSAGASGYGQRRRADGVGAAHIHSRETRAASVRWHGRTRPRLQKSAGQRRKRARRSTWQRARPRDHRGRAQSTSHRSASAGRSPHCRWSCSERVASNESEMRSNGGGRKSERRGPGGVAADTRTEKPQGANSTSSRTGSAGQSPHRQWSCSERVASNESEMRSNGGGRKSERRGSGGVAADARTEKPQGANSTSSRTRNEHQRPMRAQARAGLDAGAPAASRTSANAAPSLKLDECQRYERERGHGRYAGRWVTCETRDGRDARDGSSGASTSMRSMRVASIDRAASTSQTRTETRVELDVAAWMNDQSGGAARAAAAGR
ncbi:hypothetical protein DFH09DRAFT_1069406 [Mycena vulgaris]|nr:hypothetical protein DFH09DRAFT_1069406 [Mycena vulgaris]